MIEVRLHRMGTTIITPISYQPLGAGRYHIRFPTGDIYTTFVNYSVEQAIINTDFRDPMDLWLMIVATQRLRECVMFALKKRIDPDLDYDAVGYEQMRVLLKKLEEASGIRHIEDDSTDTQVAAAFRDIIMRQGFSAVRVREDI